MVQISHELLHGKDSEMAIREQGFYQGVLLALTPSEINEVN